MQKYELDQTPYASEQDRREQEIQRKKDRIGLAIKGLLVLLVLITLGSCASRMAYRASAPVETLGGQVWDSSWTVIGKKLGVDETRFPQNWELDYNQEISVSDKVSMALYGYGTPEVVPYIDNNDKEAERNRYDAGFYILTRGSGGVVPAQSDLEEWKSVLRSGCVDFHAAGSKKISNSGEEVVYECWTYTYDDGKSEDYHQGVCACAVASDWAFFYQLDWNDSLGWTESEGLEEMEEILKTFHYAK